MIVGPRVGHRTLHPIRIRIREHLTSINLLRVSPIKAGDSLTRVGDNLTKQEIKVGDLKVNPIKVGDLKVNPIKVGDLKVNPIKAGDLKVNPIKAGGLRVNPTRVGDRQGLRVSLIKGGTHKDSPIKVGDKQALRVNLTKANLTRVGDTKLLLVGGSKDISRDMVRLLEMMIT